MKELKSHMVAGHRDVSHQCDECEFAMVNRGRVRIHVEAVHRDVIINVMSVSSQQ